MATARSEKLINEASTRYDSSDPRIAKMTEENSKESDTSKDAVVKAITDIYEKEWDDLEVGVYTDDANLKIEFNTKLPRAVDFTISHSKFQFSPGLVKEIRAMFLKAKMPEGLKAPIIERGDNAMTLKGYVASKLIE